MYVEEVALNIKVARKRFSPLPYLLLLPTVVFVALFTAWPVLLSIYQSLFRQRMNIARFREPVFIGLGNYFELFSDPYFRQVVLNTVKYILGTVPLSIALGLLFALLVNRRIRGEGLFRLAFFHPMVLPMVSAATIWMFFFTPGYGLFNTALRTLGYTGPENWTGNPSLALVAVMIVAIWKNSGYYMIFYLAGMQNLPADVYEAAALDGANGWQILWKITLPLLRRTTVFITTIAVIDAFRTVDHIFVLTRGGPSRASTVLLFELWLERFEYQDIGVSAAITVIFIVVLLAFTVTNFLISERREA
ncbi:MAG: sugar ABC transporter permease [Anaerolineae bacterium]|nr:MAG: sugar ABC transporter permease [Anaerolineae bacterium]